jgi:hypothetical protein
MFRSLPLMVFFALLPLSAKAVQIYDNFPDAIHATERYVIYSHGTIAEGNDPKPVSPKYGYMIFRR